MSSHYDTIGKTYTATRAADPRIVQWLVDLLGLTAPAKILDIGAGTGNYSLALAELGYIVTAVEPSEVMRAQAKTHANLSFHTTSAEAMCSPDNSFDGAIMTLCLHHLKDWRFGVAEALRLSGGGPLAIFAFDTKHLGEYWLYDYFPQFREIDATFGPTMNELEQYVVAPLDAKFERFPFPLPKDLVDHFASADWAKPEVYLEEKFRKGISSFAKLDEENLERGLIELQSDLENGGWHDKYGELLENDTYDRGYLFVRIAK
ncbi:MAG: methyltransferase domain-containing protein [Pseudomonadales bacterium]|nr:methyltransferase domain-containing protein [Pseudomonadales bacterium]